MCKTILKAIKIVTEIIVCICTALTLILVYETLREMQTERNNAYMPTIVVTNSEDTKFAENSKSKLSVPADVSECLTLKNIGCWSAVGIEVTLDCENYIGLVGLLNNTDKNNTYEFEKYNTDRFFLTVNDSKMQETSVDKYNKVYLLPNANESWNIYLDPVYMTLLNKALSLGNLGDDKPITYLTIKYKDIQGKEYNKRIALECNNLMIKYKTDGLSDGIYHFSMK